MKNEHIKNLSQEVPPQIRLEVYEEAIKRTQFVIDNYNLVNVLPFGYSRGLCLLLPVCLWDLKDCHVPCPDGTWWAYYDTELAFPELGLHIKNILEELKEDHSDLSKDVINRLRIRINFLNKFMKQIQNTDTNGNNSNSNE